jgi:hypothetical protein
MNLLLYYKKNIDMSTPAVMPSVADHFGAEELIGDTVTVGTTYSFPLELGPAGRQSLYDVVYTGNRDSAIGNRLDDAQYEHDGIQKKYYFRHYQTQTPGPATLYTGTHTTRTHRYRHITANKHKFIHTRTVHINADHAAAGEANGYSEIDDNVFTDRVGTPLSQAPIDLQWSGSNWVLPSDFNNNDAQTKYFVIAANDIYKPENTETNEPSSFPDSDGIPDGITQVDALDTLEPGVTNAIAESLDDTNHNTSVTPPNTTSISNFINDIRDGP